MFKILHNGVNIRKESGTCKMQNVHAKFKKNESIPLSFSCPLMKRSHKYLQMYTTSYQKEGKKTLFKYFLSSERRGAGGEKGFRLIIRVYANCVKLYCREAPLVQYQINLHTMKILLESFALLLVMASVEALLTPPSYKMLQINGKDDKVLSRHRRYHCILI